MELDIQPIKAFNDNYIWCMVKGPHCVVVDPGDAAPVLDYCKQHKLTLNAILITHHHWDHTNGINDLLNEFGEIPVYGPQNPQIPQITHPLKQGQQVDLAALALNFSVIEVPGHTLDHIAYHGDDMLFCGDTLFSAGCGRLFEGSPQQMFDSLEKLANLAPQTKVYCTHEYTQANIKFALAVEPNNQQLLEYEQWAVQQRQQGLPTLPSSIAKECAINPFLRCQETEVMAVAQSHSNGDVNSALEAFSALRSWKDHF